jgi:hypothetical protein
MSDSIDFSSALKREDSSPGNPTVDYHIHYTDVGGVVTINDPDETPTVLD